MTLRVALSPLPDVDDELFESALDNFLDGVDQLKEHELDVLLAAHGWNVRDAEMGQLQQTVSTLSPKNEERAASEADLPNVVRSDRKEIRR